MKRYLTFKFILIFILFILLSSMISFSLYYMDKAYFLCPINFSGDIIIRNDDYGDGVFNSRRSGGRHHAGIDLLADVGTPIFASRRGVVVEARENNGMGKYVEIKHNGGLTTIYGHLSEIDVSRGQMVRQGDLLGRVGKTGNARNPAMKAHLHFEVRKNNIPQDPMEYLRRCSI